MRRLGVRVAITILVPLAFFALGDRVLLPNADAVLAAARQGAGRIDVVLSVFLLGVTPLLWAYAIVEAVAFVIPRLSRLRHCDPAGRAKLERAARVVAVLLAAFQAFGVATSLAAIGASDLGSFDAAPVWLVTASLVGGFCVVMLAVDLITRQGIANGLVLLAVLDAIRDLRTSVLAPVENARLVGEADTRALVLLALAFAVPTAAAFFALRRGGADARRARANAGGAPYRAESRIEALEIEPWIPTP
jgi:preprotein translocase subunit SecY